MTRFWRWFWALLIGVPIVALSAWGLQDNARLFVITLLNGLTLASLYFIVASGFTLVFGLMRNVNLAHGSLYLLGGYLGFFTAEFTGSWLLALPALAAADRRRDRRGAVAVPQPHARRHDDPCRRRRPRDARGGRGQRQPRLCDDLRDRRRPRRLRRSHRGGRALHGARRGHA